MSGWSAQAKVDKKAAEKPIYGREYYTDLLTQKRDISYPVRLAMVGKENTLKTGLALNLALSQTDGQVVILDIDNSASQTVATNYADSADRITIIPIFDEADSSIFHDDNSTDWTALIDKMGWFIRLLGEQCRQGAVGAVVLDGCSTLLKWCEFAMTNVLMNRSKNPINVDDGDRFNQAEWRTRNKLFRDIVNRAHQLPINFVAYTFHLKDVKEFMDIGSGQKGLQKIGEVPEWENGTKRLFSQQIWLTRYTQKGDLAAGVKADSTLKAGEWVIRASIEEMKGLHQEYLGTTHDVLTIKDKEISWVGLPFLTWETPESKEEVVKDEETTEAETTTEEGEVDDGGLVS